MSDESGTARIVGDGAAGREIYAYIYDHFGTHAFTRDESSDYSKITDERGWRWIRDFMQRLLAMEDLETAVDVHARRETQRLFEECGCGRDDDALPRTLEPPRISWTWLEAAYECLGDVEGLCRLYSYRIVTDTVDGLGGTDEERRRRHLVHVRKLRNIAGDDWRGYVDRIVDLQERYHGDPMFHGRNPAYEELLKQETLDDAAWRYCKARCCDSRDEHVIENLFEVMARGHAEEACDLLLEPLRDADSEVMRSDSERNVKRICAMLRLVAKTMDVERMADEANRLLRMYRGRKTLRGALTELLEEYAENRRTE